ncbi:uncharacterized protein B0H64DRAFT_227045 [Chaetomium fimeti]|uniref:Uncharacterized protein n=1 Tax=Chaetomium fimeti TaxID=1854472 RepID=A0AAE0H9G3_9PEZI|nr:hypothetical protein B0H64DRAFT_227045 [Chaetomium fimeti]
MASRIILEVRAAPADPAACSKDIVQNAHKTPETRKSAYIERQMGSSITSSTSRPAPNTHQAIVHEISISPTLVTLPGMILTQKKSHPQDDKKLGDGKAGKPDKPDKLDEPDSAAMFDRGNSPHEPCFQGVSAATATTATPYSLAAFSADANRRSVTLASLTSSESHPARNDKRHSTSNTDREANLLEPCLQAITLSPRSGVDSTVVARSAFTSLETIQAAQNKAKTPDKGDKAAESDSEDNDDVVSPESPRDIPHVAASPARRQRAAGSSTVPTGHRPLLCPRMRRKSSHRTVQKKSKGGNQAQQRSRARRVPQANNQLQQQSRAPREPQTNVAVPSAACQPRIPRVDMEGVPHVVGGLVESSLGIGSPLFARQVEGDPLDPYNSVKVDRHEFFHFPPPDMGEHNREFERQLEESRPVYEGFGSDFIDEQLSSYAARTKAFAKAMEERHADLDRANDSLLFNKEKLAHLNHERQRAIANKFSRGKVMTRKEQTKLFARIGEAEEILTQEQDLVHQELDEVIMRCRAEITSVLHEDLRPPTVIDRKRSRTHERKTVEEQGTELAIAVAMTGLRGTLKEQDQSTQEAIMHNAQLVVDQQLKAFDQQDDWRKSAEPTPIPPTSNVDAVVTSVPEWFTIMEAKKAVPLRGATLLDKFKDLLLLMGTSVKNARAEQWGEGFRPNKHTWNKQHHQPNGAWPNTIQRIRGGWWHCRNGPDASAPERNCELCHREVPVPRVEDQGPSEKQRYQRLLENIEAAQAEANKKDRLSLKHQLQQEREDINQYWQQREWRRSGGGVDVSEVLHGRDVNDLNYRSSTEPQSWRHPPPLFWSPEHHGEQAIKETLASPTTPLPIPQRLCGSGKKVSPGSRSAGDPSTPPRHLGRSPRFYELPPSGQLNGDLGSPGINLSQPARPLHGSTMFHELLSGRKIKEDIKTRTTPTPGLHRHNSSQVHDILHDRHGDNDPPSPTQDGPSQLRSSMSRPGQCNKQKTVSWQI